MSFYEDYVADGLCCQSCGALLDGNEPGYARFCAACEPPAGWKGPNRVKGKQRGKRKGMAHDHR